MKGKVVKLAEYRLNTTGLTFASCQHTWSGCLEFDGARSLEEIEQSPGIEAR